MNTLPVADAVRRGSAIHGGPVLLLNTADTTGGGAAGDSIEVARSLIEAGVTERALAMVVDPGAARQAHQIGVGAEAQFEIGHRVDPRWGVPWRTRARVERLLDGRFRYTGGVFGGTEADMGPSAVLAIGNLRLLVMSHSTYDWADEQYRAAGLDPASVKWLEVKNMMNFRRCYGEVMKAAYVLDAPGPTPPDMRSLPFERAHRPWYPMDPDTPGVFEIREHVVRGL